MGEKDTMHETRMRSGVKGIHVRSRYHRATFNTTTTHCEEMGQRRRRGHIESRGRVESSIESRVENRIEHHIDQIGIGHVELWSRFWISPGL